jgi:hypothetical protein
MAKTRLRHASVPERRQRPDLRIILAGFKAHLWKLGYTSIATAAYCGAAEHFTAWQIRCHHNLSAMDEYRIGLFVTRHLPRCRCRGRTPRYAPKVQSALRRLLRFLQDNGWSSPAARLVSFTFGPGGSFRGGLGTNDAAENSHCRSVPRSASQFRSEERAGTTRFGGGSVPIGTGLAGWRSRPPGLGRSGLAARNSSDSRCQRTTRARAAVARPFGTGARGPLAGRSARNHYACGVCPSPSSRGGIALRIASASRDVPGLPSMRL